VNGEPRPPRNDQRDRRAFRILRRSSSQAARPYLLDDATVERLLRTYSETEADLWLYDTQLDRWARQARTIDQRREVARPQAQMICLRDVVGQILALGARLKTQTIEALLAKSDLDVAVEHLLGGEATGR